MGVCVCGGVPSSVYKCKIWGETGGCKLCLCVCFLACLFSASVIHTH